MTSVALIFDNFGPYHLARLQAAATVCDLLAIEVAGASSVYAWENDPKAGTFQRVTLIEQATSDDVRPAELCLRLVQALEKCKPAIVVVPGWASPAAWGAITWCVQRRVPMVVMSESTAWDEPRSGWKEWIKRKLVALYSSALVGGQSHHDYLIKLGLPGERIFLGYDVIDNAYFSDPCAAISSRREEVRQEYGLPNAYFLASARFVEKKNLPRLLQAYARYRVQCQKATPWSLVLLGDGILRRDLESQLDALNLRDHVLMPGFKQYADLPAYYALASAFIHPSIIEPWGLVVNEAMACGLPVLVSNRCGCAPELVREGVNGFTFDPLDIEEIAQKMLRLTHSPALLPALGQASREIIAQWSPQRFADGLTQALAAASSTPLPHADWLARRLLGILLRR